MPYKPKKQTPAHKKQLERVRQFIRRAEKRGFRFTDDFKSSLKDLKTVQLKALKPEKLYSLSTALSEYGDIVTGTERRKEERSLSAKKSAQTRKKKKQQKEQQYYPDGGEIIYGNIVEEYILYGIHLIKIVSKTGGKINHENNANQRKHKGK